VLGDDFCISLARSRLNEFPVIGMSNVFSGMEMLQIGVADVGIEWFTKLIDIARARMSEFNQKDLCRAIQSLAGLRLGPEEIGEDFFRAWAQRATEPGIEFDPSELGYTLDGLRMLGLTSDILGTEFGEKVFAMREHNRLNVERHAVALVALNKLNKEKTDFHSLQDTLVLGDGLMSSARLIAWARLSSSYSAPVR
jgi:hypothetical protein